MFWLEVGGRFIHIQYLALRDGTGEYRGVLAYSEDGYAITEEGRGVPGPRF